MNVWKAIAIVSSSLLAVIIACGGARMVELSAAADQPNMVAARDHLVEARTFLDRADPDKGGHRERAIALVDQAIRQVNEGIEYARTH
jgi:hypothetical protein